MKKLVKILLFVLCLAALTSFVFSSEISDFIDSVYGQMPNGGHRVDDGHTTLRSFRLLKPGEKLAPTIIVSQLRISGVDKSMRARLRFNLSASESSAVYPDLKIFLVDKNSKILRTVMRSSDQYDHGLMLSEEDIEVSVQLNPIEVGFTVQAFWRGP